VSTHPFDAVSQGGKGGRSLRGKLTIWQKFFCMLHVIASHQGRPADDPIFALNREATERSMGGEAIVNATVGALLEDDGQLVVLPTAARVVHEVKAEQWAAYAPLAGSPDFLRAVMDDLLGVEPALREAAVAVATPGGTGALRHAIANFLEPGQSLLTTSYFWGPYQTLADEADRKVAVFPMFASDGSLDVDGLDRAMAAQVTQQGRVLLFLNDPCHNPTGYSMRLAEWRAVVERVGHYADKVPVALLVDCAYFAYGPGEPRAFLGELLPLLGRAALLFAWTASKTFTHYGLRVGAIVACIADPDERRGTMAALSYSCRGTWSNCNSGGLAAITRLLTDPALARACNEERARSIRMLAARVSAFNALAKARGLRYPRYDGGFFVTVFDEDAARKAQAMRKAGVYVVPQLSKAGTAGALRVALCSVAERDVARLVDALASA
jgi:aromatic-amino-acid transaminase